MLLLVCSLAHALCQVRRGSRIIKRHHWIFHGGCCTSSGCGQRKEEGKKEKSLWLTEEPGTQHAAVILRQPGQTRAVRPIVSNRLCHNMPRGALGNSSSVVCAILFYIQSYSVNWETIHLWFFFLMWSWPVAHFSASAFNPSKPECCCTRGRARTTLVKENELKC